MKAGTLFWGMFFLTLGSLFLIDNYANIDFEIYQYWKMWPVVLILFGLYFVFKGSFLRWLFIFVNSILIAFLLFSFFNNDFIFEYDENDANVNIETFKESYSPNLKEASLTFRGGAGKIFIKDSTSEMIEIDSRSSFGNNHFYYDTLDGKARAEFEIKGKRNKIRKINFKGSNSEIKLNPNAKWDLKFDIGASSAELDLSNFNTNFLKFNSGASSVDLKLGSLSDFTKVNFESGVSRIQISVPENIGCQINSESEFSQKNFAGFEKVDDQTYQTSNFNDKEKKIIIDLNADVSSITVNRY